MFLSLSFSFSLSAARVFSLHLRVCLKCLLVKPLRNFGEFLPDGLHLIYTNDNV